jgi:cell division initiation protein
MNSKSIHEKQFKTKLNGYSCVEVDQFMNEVADEIDCLNTSVEELKTKYAAAAAQLESYRDMDKILRDTLITAQKSANDMYEDARARAAQATSAAKEQAQENTGTSSRAGGRPSFRRQRSTPASFIRASRGCAS